MPLTANISDAREALERDMATVEQATISLRTQYNALSPVNHLPPETLAHIFHFLRDIYEPIGKKSFSSSNDSLPPQAIGWIQVTHVCHRWRTIALEHHILWSNIMFDLGHRWTEEFFRRSQKAPLVIERFMPAFYNLPDDHSGDFIVDIAHHLSHIRVLSIITTVADLTAMAPSLRSPAPLLEKLSLYNATVSSGIDDSDVTPSLPPDLFSKLAPRLSDVRLISWCIPWLSTAFESVVYLRVTRNRCERIGNANELEKFLGALERMPVLESLCIQNIMPRPPAGVTPHYICGPIVALPKLHISTSLTGLKTAAFSLSISSCL
ncbi:hypothetical protein EVG20_g3348 [Dentipellis fragilis]|uniref:F-box domain-containing protein n=1 Tax=Dentipellis fragilis TaxID=205917 RepID=A0A4Y9Z4X3_9AGAM|nr:hypothetical protein EVG20_g3348 [Dentipellis fragilis]